MGNLMTSIYTGVSGLRVNQVSLNTTAHNLANVDTLGFTRQQILSSDFIYNRVGQSYNSGMLVGLGTDMAAIRRVREVFFDQSYRVELGRKNFHESQYKTVDEIETIFAEINEEGFKNSLSDMWGAIAAISKESDSIVNRGILVSTAKSFLDKAERIKEQLESYQKNLNDEINKQVKRINQIGDQINQLNEEILKNESTGQRANDFRDTRDLLLDELGGLVDMSYREETNGKVTVSVENVQFITENRVYHMKAEFSVIPEEKEKADKINEYLTDLEGLDADAIRASQSYKNLCQYGKVKVTEDGGITKVIYNDVTMIDNKVKILDMSPKQSQLLNVVWDGNGMGDVFRLDGNYSVEAKTDIGSLKGLLVSRGAYNANYTDIPKESDFPDNAFGKALYEQEKDRYNKYVDKCVVMSTQAQFDQLINSIVTAINDILCPNTDITESKISELLTKTGSVTLNPSDIDLTGAKVVLADGSIMNADEVRIFDMVEAGCGMDAEKTQGEALFNRKNTERYTDGELTVLVKGVPTKVKVRVYNKEHDSNENSQFTTGQIEINQEILNDYDKIPLHYNKLSGRDGQFNQGVLDALMSAWDKEDLYLDPNTLTKNSFQNYYKSMTERIAYRGDIARGIVESQTTMLETIDNGRLQTSGVSSDEELTNMIKYQHAYNASSRYINTINEMLEHVIQKLG